MIPAAFEYHAPSTLGEALAILRRHPGDARVLAGGHSLLPMMKLRLAQPSHVVDLGRIGDLDYITERDEGLAIGPVTTCYTLEASELVRELAPLLAETAAQVADLQVRNKGSIGGSIAHADPAADLPAAMLALEARIRTSGGGRARSLPASRFFVDLFTTALRETEIITEVFVPQLPAQTGVSYQKFANKASRFAVVGVAALVTLDERGLCRRVRIGVTGAGPKAVRGRALERYLTGKAPTARNLSQAARRAAAGIEFLGDQHGSEEYREHLTHVLAVRALEEAAGRAAA